ncbi:MAG: hypothetical protein OEW86_00165 [Nitrosopumilus sp.]|nr:hypothetical protein [Nitrosopumilus sp.]MDH3516495.1 hypothetical protein [Nitrosopumilus sp.]MDH5416385.1 hypothetical protein [Nitrosopumilus sp.]MDH5553710.1 hypothetical protein [Nitrosopumilus sp.]
MASFDLPANFLSFLQHGSLKITCDGIPSINFMAEGRSRIVDVIDIPIEITKRPGLIKGLSEAKELAKNLKQENITLEIRLQGEPVLKLGEKANPKLAKIVTLSGDIEITDLRKLKKLSDEF